MLWRTTPSVRSGRRKPAGFILPCQPTLSLAVPSGPQWIHELKHDGFRILARKDGAEIRLWSRSGRDYSREFAAITQALRALPADAVIDGEAAAHCADGLPDFHRLNSRDGARAACLYAFDLLSVAGEDLRDHPLLERRARLAAILPGAPPALILSEHLAGEHGEAMFREACRMGLEGIVSKRADRPYRSGRSPYWLKIKNPSYRRA